MGIRRFILAVLVAVSVAACATTTTGTAPPAAAAPEPPSPPVDTSPPPEWTSGSTDALLSSAEFVRVPTYFATDRLYHPDSEPLEVFDGQPGTLNYGVASVTIPIDRDRGDIPRPGLFGLLREDPAKHVILESVAVLPPDDFYAMLSRRLRNSGRQSALIFVHGYNVSFPEAAWRTAQMAYDLEFDGAPVFYSWPSAGSTLAYARDARNIEASQPTIEAFLVDFFRRSTAEEVFLIAHSMGNRATTRAIAAAAVKEPSIRSRLKQVVLAAPDVDARVFRTQIAPSLVDLGAPVTLYASSGDLPLRLAQRLYGGFPRAGQAGEGIVVYNGIDTIDVSAVETDFLGHSMFSSEDPLLLDMLYMFQGIGPAARARLRQAMHPNGIYWLFTP